MDWELELAVVIGRRAKRVSEADALNYVAGYTVVNDVTQRKFQPNPGPEAAGAGQVLRLAARQVVRHVLPVRPVHRCPRTTVPDPQALKMTLTLNGQVRQDGSTAQQVFPVAAVIAFISEMTTLEPGDLISTGTPAGVGSATGTYLKPGDVLRGTIERIGTLVTPVEAE